MARYPSHTLPLAVKLAAALLVLSSLPGVAAMRSNYWADADGVFSNTASWTDTSFYPSTTNDWAFFTNAATRKVTFDADALNFSTQIRGGEADIHWDLGGYTYTLTSQNTSTDPLGDGTALVVGSGSDGANLTVSNGTLVTSGFFVGRNHRASLIITGNNTHWINNDGGEFAALVGWAGATAGESVLRIENGATAQLNRLRISHSGGSRGTMIITGQGSSVTNISNPAIGNFGRGKVVVADGAQWVVPNNTINFGYGTLGTHDGGGILEIDGGRVEARNVRFDRGSVINTFKVTLYSGGTNALVTAGRDFFLGAGNTIFELALDDGFSADLGEVFTIVHAVADGGNYNFSGKFTDDQGQDLEDGAVLTAGTFFDTYEFEANYTADHRFTLTVIPEPGSMALLGLAGVVLLLRRRRSHTRP